LARWLADGNIEFLGRIDEQVKIRGFRIELGEIDNAIRKIESIKDVAVIVRNDNTGEKAIYAYVVSGDGVSSSFIRDKLSKVLPYYMIPSYIMQIDKIPVTRNGKLDKRALPEIEVTIGKEYVGPTNRTEEILCGIFSEVLGISKVGIKDNFFEIGGDSIKAIRIVSKLRGAGYEVSVKSIMYRHNVESIAEEVKKILLREYEQKEVVGLIKPTPIIEKFEEWNLSKPEHFNQAVMIKIKTREVTTIKRALSELVKHHDMLRSVYRNKQLIILSSSQSKMFDFKVFNFINEVNVIDKIKEESTRQQGSIDLENGPLLKTALFITDTENLLFICLHHLIVDGVSWRILLEDFHTAIKQIETGESIRLPMKTASFKAWGDALEEYKQSSKLRKEKAYWEQVVYEIEKGCIEYEDITEGKGYGYITLELSNEETKKLLREANKAFNTEINDLLISSLSQAIGRLSGQKKVTIGFESHGREEIHRKISIDRTIGWFTSMYPIVVDYKEEVKESIVTTKDLLRKVPNHGLGYGLLEKELDNKRVDLYFNYMGEMDAEAREESSEGDLCGLSIATENRTPGYINFNGGIEKEKLSFVIRYDMSKYSEETINKLVNLFKKVLKDTVNYCIIQKECVKTVSDFDSNKLTLAELDEIEFIYNGGIKNG